MEYESKLRERVELTLDNKQIFLIFSVSAIVLSATFALGVVVGKRLGPEVPSEPETDPLALLDQLSRQQGARHADLTFADALTAPPDAGKSRPSRPAPLAAAPKRAEPAEAAKPSRKADPAQPEPPPKPVARPAARLDQGEAVQPAARREQAEAVQPVASQAPEVIPPEEGKTEAVAPAPRDVASGDPSRGKGRYTLQLSAFRDRSEADQFASALRAKGLDPRVTMTKIPNRGTWYRVRVGRFTSWPQAVAAKERFEREHDAIAYVATQ